MAVPDWTNLFGVEIPMEVARKASDFDEVLSNMRIDPDFSYELLASDKTLAVHKRLYFVARASEDIAARVMLTESDPLVAKVGRARLDETNAKSNPIIV